jgi:hypothetical protein
MRDEQRYHVTGAILSEPRKSVHVWTVSFRPGRRPSGLPFDPDAGKEITVTILPRTLEEMRFDREYTKAEIEALRAAL